MKIINISILILFIHAIACASCDTASLEMYYSKYLNYRYLYQSKGALVSAGFLKMIYFKSEDTCFCIDQYPNIAILQYLSEKLIINQISNKKDIKRYLKELLILFSSVNKIININVINSKANYWNVIIKYEEIKWEESMPIFSKKQLLFIINKDGKISK